MSKHSENAGCLNRWPVFALAIISIIYLFSCSPYSRIEKRNPLTHSDSMSLARVCNTVYPFIPYTTVDSFFKPSPDSSQFYGNKLDSANKAYKDLLSLLDIKYQDTCKEAVKDAADVCNACYQQGFYQGKLNVKHDTLEINHRTNTQVTVKEKLAEGYLQEQTEKTIKETSAKKTWRGIAIAEGIFLLLGGLFVLFYIKSLNKKAST